MTRNTRYADGLFEGAELDAKAIKDKDAKVAYLTKIFNCVGISSGVTLQTRPLKVVAGLEPERTNAFLQALARVAARGEDADAVARCRRG